MRLKSRYLFTIIVLSLILLVSCANKEATNDSKDIDGDVLTSQGVKDYEKVFETVEVKDEDKYPLRRLKEVGTVKGVLSNGEILLLIDSELCLYNIDKEDKVILEEYAYNVLLSHDKSFVLYENEEGIHLLSLNNKKSKLIYPIKDEIFRDIILREDDKEIIIQTIQEEKYKTYILDTKGNSREIDISEGESFLLNQLISYDGHYLIGIAQISGLENKDLVNYSTNLVRIDVRNGNIKNLTNLEADDQIIAIGDYAEGEKLIKIVKHRMNKDEELERAIEFRRVNTSKGYLSAKTKLEDVTILKVLGNKELVYLKAPEEYDYNYPDSMDIVLEKNGKANVIGRILSGIPNQLFIMDNELIFNSNDDIYCIKIQ